MDFFSYGSLLVWVPTMLSRRHEKSQAVVLSAAPEEPRLGGVNTQSNPFPESQIAIGVECFSSPQCHLI